MFETRPTAGLTRAELADIRALMDLAFAGDFGDADWEHILGGWHAVARVDGVLVAHVAVVPRLLRIGDRPLRTGYVEGMATHPDHRRRGHAARLLRAVNAHIIATYELGALSDGTGIEGFYQRHGWRAWTGKSFVDGPRGREATPDEDGGILVLPTPACSSLDTRLPITCDWRAGDVW
jgi:aminoglycoside 2'-N-acetyltransferase I